MIKSMPDAPGFGGTGTLYLCVDGVIKTTYVFKRCKKKTACTAAGIYKDAVFDTKGKSLPRRISAEKGLISRDFSVPPFHADEL